MGGSGRVLGLLDRNEYRDKVYACWLGKTCGGTLGAPLEELFGRDEPFDVQWYPELRDGGIPNDDLELQLILLKAVEEVGFDLTARDLARYWLAHVGYNFDEYGLAKTNLRLGLLPPLSGSYNNWFRDCMGAPIRSELWACLAPGRPALAVHYAYQDALVDHAGGEGVWGELFNAAVQSAAFVETDPRALLDIGLSYIPPDCAVARAVRVARAAYGEGVDWRAARRRVLAAVPSRIAQYAPPNIGFQVIGWLYGGDFGDALCTAVNCGYDTDCTGATLGALLGIVGGRAGLPARWIAPLGDGIATNESWGGLRAISIGPNPAPATLVELTERVCALGQRLHALQDVDGAPASRVSPAGGRVRPGVQTGTGDDDGAGALCAPDDAAARWWEPSPTALRHELGALVVEVDYGGAPVVAPGITKRIVMRVRNPHPEALTLDVSLAPPKGWTVAPAAVHQVDVPAGGVLDLPYTVGADVPALIRNTNRALLTVQPRGRPAEQAVQVALLGARRWLLRGDDGTPPSDDAPAAMSAPPLVVAPEGPGEDWRAAYAPGNALPDDIDRWWTGMLHARLYLWSPSARDVRIGVPATCPRALWLNERLVLEACDYDVLRPNYGHGGGDGASYVDTALREGWNEACVTYTRDADGARPPFAAHFTLSTPDMYDGIVDIEWTRAPWDE